MSTLTSMPGYTKTRPRTPQAKSWFLPHMNLWISCGTTDLELFWCQPSRKTFDALSGAQTTDPCITVKMFQSFTNLAFFVQRIRYHIFVYQFGIANIVIIILNFEIINMSKTTLRRRSPRRKKLSIISKRSYD